MLKLGTQTGSLTNHIYSRAVNGQPEPAVGMGATILGWTDRHAATITKVWRSSKTGPLYLIVKEDTATVIKGSIHNGTAEYSYAPNPQGSETYFRQRKDGQWQATAFNGKRYVKVEGYGLRIGEREEHYDPSF